MLAMEAAAAGHVGVFPLGPSDGDALRRLFYRLSPTTVYRRFHGPIVRPEQAQPDRLLDIDHHDREAVVAVLDGEILGVARYVRRAGTDSAEVAVVVADSWQRQGLATRMCSMLSTLATTEGVRQFTLSMQPDNP